MENPVKEIEPVIRLLTQGSPNEQQDAVNTYFTPTASFVHPFCRVPSFGEVWLPFFGYLTSRSIYLAVLRWYRAISPRVDLVVNGAVLHEESKTLYVDINQRMALCFVPFYVARVHLVTVLSLVEDPVLARRQRRLVKGEQVRQAYYDHATQHRAAHGAAPAAPRPVSKSGDGGAELPSFAEVAASAKPLLSDKTVTFTTAASSTNDHQEDGHVQDGHGDGPRFLIAKQEDLYQTNQWIKFLLPFGIGSTMVVSIQVFVAAFCAVSVVFTFPIVWLLDRGGVGGNVMPLPGSKRKDGAEWARRKFSPMVTALGLDHGVSAM